MSQATREPRGVKGGIPSYQEPTPETYQTYRFPSQPEKPYLTTEKPPSQADVTLVKPEPSVRRQIFEQLYEPSPRIEAARQKITEAKQRLSGVEAQLAGTQFTLYQLRPSLYYKELEKQTEYKGLEQFPLEQKERAIYLHQVMGYGFEEMAEREAKQPGWFGAEVKAHYGVAEPVTLEDLVTMASLASAVYGYATLTKAVVAPKLAAAWKGSSVESWLLRHSDWYAKRAAQGLAPQIVATQQIGADIPLSFGKMKAAETAWELAYTPKSSLVTIGVSPEIIAKTKVLPHGFFRQGLFATGYLRELSFAQPTYGGLLSQEPLITETITREAQRTIPYLPKLETMPKMAPKLFFLMPPIPSQTAKVTPKITVKPTPATKERLQPYLPTRQIVVPTPETITRNIVVPKVKPIAIAEPKTLYGIESIVKLVPRERQITRTVQQPRQISIPRTPTMPQIPKSPQLPFSEFGRPLKKLKKRKRKKGLVGRYPRKYPVWTAQEVLEKIVL